MPIGTLYAAAPTVINATYDKIWIAAHAFRVSFNKRCGGVFAKPPGNATI